LIFRARTLAHFAVDPDEVYVATKLARDDTVFLPFNQGYGGGAGNPPPDAGDYRTSYLWRSIWSRDAWLRLLGAYVSFTATTVGGLEEDRRLLFPRFHQWDATEKVLEDARVAGAGRNYLIQHSAGSGKSNTISWLAYGLMTLVDSADALVFDKVIVVSDRVVLDAQLRDHVLAIQRTPGTVAVAKDRSEQLADALASATARIVVTTLQKFPYVLDRAAEFRGSKYAVIVDEAHSSQTGEAAAQMRQALAAERPRVEPAPELEDRDSEDELNDLLAARGPQPNISVFAFTATPKHRTLQVFGIPQEDGTFRAFHLYTMRQAIEEEFIFDVLANYTTYATYYRVGQRATEDPEVDRRRANAAIARWVSLHERQLDEKAELVIEHFLRHTQAKIGGRARAMWVTASRPHAVRSYFALRRYVALKGYDIGVLVAFSGTINVDGIDYSEPELNGFSESALRREFRRENAFRILVVADKYQTGYDEGLLHTMFVDRRLDGVRAVQTLSRLNRLQEGKEDTFVLDFANRAEAIQEAFRPFYEATITEPTDPNILYNAMDAVEQATVIDPAEVDAVVQILFRPVAEPGDHAALYAALQPAVERVAALTEDNAAEFRGHLERFTKLYSFVSQILPAPDAEAEKLYQYGSLLLRRLPGRGEGGLSLGDHLILTHLRLAKTGDHDLSLSDGGSVMLPGFGGDGAGTHRTEEVKALLSELLRMVNERFGMDLGKADQLVFEQIIEEMVDDPELAATANANSLENFRFGFDRKFEPAVMERYDSNIALIDRLLSDERLSELVRGYLVGEVYERLRVDPDVAP
jgi:type I restriction enzyme R subunit